MSHKNSDAQPTGKFSEFFSSSRAKEDGNILLEFTISAALLIIVVIGLVDYGLRLQEHSELIDAARMASRTAAKDRTASAAQLTAIAETAAAGFLTAYGLQPASYTVRVRPVAMTGANGIKVIVTRNSSAALFSQSLFFSCASATFRTESGIAPTSTWAAGNPDC